MWAPHLPHLRPDLLVKLGWSVGFAVPMCDIFSKSVSHSLHGLTQLPDLAD